VNFLILFKKLLISDQNSQNYALKFKTPSQKYTIPTLTSKHVNNPTLSSTSKKNHKQTSNSSSKAHKNQT
jgi:hypothetical protein